MTHSTLPLSFLSDPQDPEVRKNEKLTTEVFKNSLHASQVVAEEIASLIRQRQGLGKMAVLGLATGSTPIKVYEKLVRMHREDGLSFRNVITFNLDEYYPMDPGSIHSYHRFMQEHLFDHIDIEPENVHIPNGQLSEEQIKKYCLSYENKIEEAGGLDIQVLGIGRTGHIGFNEPGSSLTSKTRLIRLDRVRMD